MDPKLLHFCFERKILLDKEVMNVFEEMKDLELAKGILDKIVFQFNQRVITKGFFSDNKYQLNDLLSYHTGRSKELIQEVFKKLGLEAIESPKEKQISRVEEGVGLIGVYQNTYEKKNA